MGFLTPPSLLLPTTLTLKHQNETPVIFPVCRLSQFEMMHAFFTLSGRGSVFRLRMLQDVVFVAHDVFARPRVESEPATVQPVHTRLLLSSRGLVWLEEYLLTERGILLLEWCASGALVRCHPAASNVERRQSPCCMPYKPLRTELSRQSSIARICPWKHRSPRRTVSQAPEIRSDVLPTLEPNLYVIICTGSPVLPSWWLRTPSTVVCKLRNRCFQLSSRCSVLLLCMNIVR